MEDWREHEIEALVKLYAMLTGGFQLCSRTPEGWVFDDAAAEVADAYRIAMERVAGLNCPGPEGSRSGSHFRWIVNPE